MAHKWVTPDGQPVPRIRITPEVVQRLSDFAQEQAGDGWGLMGVGADIGHGVRYLDGRQGLVWLGRTGARKAAAYYYGVAEAAHRGALGDLPEDVRAYGRELVRWRESAVDAGRNDYLATLR